jgi:hypothetical protein
MGRPPRDQSSPHAPFWARIFRAAGALVQYKTQHANSCLDMMDKERSEISARDQLWGRHDCSCARRR